MCIHDSEMKKTPLGQYSPILKIGDIQSFVWKEGDDGPMDMTTVEREHLQNGESATVKFVSMSKAQLKKALLDSSIELEWKGENVSVMGGKLKTESGHELAVNEMRKLCRKHNIKWKSKKPITV